MHTPHFGVSKEGLPFILFSVFSTLVLALLDWDLLAFVLLIVTFFVLHFFRDPERVVPVQANLALAPADGKVISIDQRPDPCSGESMTRVCIFMNIFNVHVNRAPVKGKVDSVVYHPGQFLNASLEKSSDQNERNTISLLDDEGRRVSMVQISGLIARRIVCWAETGDPLEKGQRVGLIKFGSRVDLYLPGAYSLQVQTGQRVFAGQTILASS